MKITDWRLKIAATILGFIFVTTVVYHQPIALAQATPTVLTFAPALGQPGTVVTVTGDHFVGVIQVLFGATPATSFTVLDEHTLIAVVPVGAKTGAISVIALQASTTDFVMEAPKPTEAPTIAPTAPPTEVIEPTEAPTPIPPTNTSVPPTPIPPTVQPTIVASGIWIGQAELLALPTSGAGWTDLKANADSAAGPVSLSDQDSNNNVIVMAQALVYARTGDTSYRDKVVGALRTIATGNPSLGRALALGRELIAYVLAADIIKLNQIDPALDAQFRAKIAALRTAPVTGGPASLDECSEERPNNWGTHCTASRIAVDLYLNDKADLDKAVKIFQGWLGDRSAYASFTYGDLWWQADPAKPVGVNPLGSTIQGHPVSGAEPEEMRRAGAFTWPPTKTDYAWEGLQGATAAGVMLSRAGYPAWEWSDKALLRATQFLYGIGWPAEGDDRWQPYVYNKVYGTNYPTTGTGGRGKNVGWTAWTMQK